MIVTKQLLYAGYCHYSDLLDLSDRPLPVGKDRSYSETTA